MKFIKSKAFLGGICLLLAAGIAFFVVPRFYSNQKSTVSVVRPTQEIAVGTVITEAMITSTEVGAYGLPERIAKEFGEVVGKVALENIHAGEFFWFDSLTTEEDYKAAVDENTKGLTDGYCLVTIKCSSASVGVAGVLRPGNIVDVFECVEDKERNTYSTIKALNDMYVYDVLNAALESLDEVDKKKENATKDSSENYDCEPAFVVIRCTESQAQTLIRLEKAEALHMTLQRTEG
jgi:pilus assembly protein CpaB